MLVMADSKKRFVDVEAGWPGSVSDARIWSNSFLNQDYNAWLSQMPSTPLQTGQTNGGRPITEDIQPFILADSAHPNTKNMVTTFNLTETRNPVIAALNEKLNDA
jgi:hypothetical protein